MLLFSGFFQNKGSYLFYSVSKNVTILFVGTKRSRFILYSISTNTQRGLIPFSMSERVPIYSSLEGPIRNNFTIYSFCIFYDFRNFYSLFLESIKSLYKINTIKTNTQYYNRKPIKPYFFLRFPIKVNF